MAVGGDQRVTLRQSRVVHPIIGERGVIEDVELVGGMGEEFKGIQSWEQEKGPCLSLDVVELVFDLLPAHLSRRDNGLKSRQPLLGDLSKIVGHFFR